MSHTYSAWLVVVLAFAIANLPFLSQRLLGLFSLSKLKTFPVRFVELMFCYFLVGGVGMALEQRQGQVASQTWEFYAITAALFVTFSFPGFVYCYLLKRNDA